MLVPSMGAGQFVVAFSSKGRGVCHSCNGRRMAQTAGHLVDRVIPPVPSIRDGDRPSVARPRPLRAPQTQGG